jgi:hypothetical protein
MRAVARQRQLEQRAGKGIPGSIRAKKLQEVRSIRFKVLLMKSVTSRTSHCSR